MRYAGSKKRSPAAARIGGVACLSLVLAGEASAIAAPAAPDLVTIPSGLNLGLSSFFDGFTPTTPDSFALSNYTKFEHLDEITDSTGRASSTFNNPRLDVFVDVLQLIWVSPLGVPGGVVGVTVLQPLVSLDSHFDEPGLVLHDNGVGLGDTVFGPYYQSLPIIRDGRPVFSYRVEMDVIAPSGSYNSKRDINQSSGYWSLIPYVAFTALPTPDIEISARMHYIYNFETNNIPNPPPIPGFDFIDGQAGQAGWINFAASYAVSPDLNAGLNGYYLKQFTNDRLNGVSLPGSQKEELYLGPGIHLPLDHVNMLNLNAYFPIESKGLPEGPQIALQYIHIF